MLILYYPYLYYRLMDISRSVWGDICATAAVIVTLAPIRRTDACNTLAYFIGRTRHYELEIDEG